jgi:hypothetical protein
LVQALIRLHHGLVASLFFILPAGSPQSRTAAPPAPQSAAINQGPASPTTFPPLPKPEPNYRFPINQTLVYGAEWRVFNAGIATLRMEQAGQQNHVIGIGDATGSVALLYHVHDHFESFFNPSDFCSRSISKNIEEGFRRVNATVDFEYQRGKAVLDQKNLRKNDTRHQENDIPGCVTDVLSGIYYAGSLPLQIGKTYSFPLNDGGKTVIVDLHVEAREQVKTPAGTFNAIRVQPESSGLLKEKGRIWLWYSDDAARIPVQMRGRMFWGTVQFKLLRIEKK